MQCIGYLSAKVLKRVLTPQQYYKIALTGSFGKHTGNYWYKWNGLCPFHDDKHAGSFVINKKTGAFHCFSCGVSGGDIIEFYKKKNNVSFQKAIYDLNGGCYA
ncbi:MAG: hypothetical protein GY793_00165 [Proteobacteria bacterium]|nr:hypothetical protein [Pseudomonadota bacterium]